MKGYGRTLMAWAAVAIALLAIGVGLWLWLRRAQGVAPSVERYEIRGLDLSAHNGPVDFDKVKEAGYEFVYLKATEGVRFKDARFRRNLASARRAGLKVGAYHFFRFDSPAHMQALNLAQSVRLQQLDLPLVIDMEQWTNPTGHLADSVLRHAAQMAQLLESQGYRVMFYTNKRGQTRWIRRDLRSYPLWICSLVDIPNPEAYTLWQHSHTGRVPGVRGNVDLNVFCGSRRQWEREMLGKGTQ